MRILAGVGFTKAGVLQIAQCGSPKLPHSLAVRRAKPRECAELGYFESERHVVQHSLVGKQRILLGNITALPVRLCPLAAVDEHASTSRFLFAEYQAQQSGFTASGLSHDRYE